MTGCPNRVSAETGFALLKLLLKFYNLIGVSIWKREVHCGTSLYHALQNETANKLLVFAVMENRVLNKVTI